MDLSKRELGAVLAGLRAWQSIQQHRGIHGLKLDPLRDIATDCGDASPLNVDEIDDLCERLNTADDWRAKWIMNRTKADDKQVAKARELYQNDDVEIDDDALISHTDAGHWVSAWVYVHWPDGVPKSPFSA